MACFFCGICRLLRRRGEVEGAEPAQERALLAPEPAQQAAKVDELTTPTTPTKPRPTVFPEQGDSSPNGKALSEPSCGSTEPGTPEQEQPEQEEDVAGAPEQEEAASPPEPPPPLRDKRRRRRRRSGSRTQKGKVIAVLQQALDALRLAELELEQIMREAAEFEEKKRREEDVKKASPELAQALQKRRQVVEDRGQAYEAPPSPSFTWRSTQSGASTRRDSSLSVPSPMDSPAYTFRQPREQAPGQQGWRQQVKESPVGAFRQIVDPQKTWQFQNQEASQARLNQVKQTPPSSWRQVKDSPVTSWRQTKDSPAQGWRQVLQK